MPWDVWDNLSRVISLNFWSPIKSPDPYIYILPLQICWNWNIHNDSLSHIYHIWSGIAISHMLLGFALPGYAYSIVVLVCLTWMLWWVNIPNVFIEVVGIEYFLHLVLGKRLRSNILLKAFLELCIFISQSSGCRVRSHSVLEEAILRIWKSEGVVCISRSF